MCLAKAFEENMIEKSTGTELVQLFASDPSRHPDLRSWLARAIIDQLLAAHPERLRELDRVQEVLQKQPVDQWQEEQLGRDGHIVSWTKSLNASNPPWQHLWSLLACFLAASEKSHKDTGKHSTEKEKTLATDTSKFVVMLFGCLDQTYQALNDGLKYVANIRPSFKFLFIGKPLPEDLGDKLGKLRYSQVSVRICEETEIQGSFSKFLLNVVN
jgi:hypothetical protein